MKNAIEAKFVNINVDDIRSRLTELGGTHQANARHAASYNRHSWIKKDAFVRIRNEGDKTTITYKQFNSLSIDG